MLRIDIHQARTATSFILAGKLMGPWVAELEKCWRTMISAEPCNPVLLDLTGVTFIDDKGKQLVARMYQSGAKLTGAGLIAELIAQEIESEEMPRSNP